MKSEELIEKLRAAQIDSDITGLPMRFDVKIQDLLDAFAEKDAEIAELKKWLPGRIGLIRETFREACKTIDTISAMFAENERLKSELAEKDRQIAHRNAKYCEAMAKWLECETNWHAMYEGDWYRARAAWFRKWWQKLQKLAEKFKRNSLAPMPKELACGGRNCKNCLQCYELEDKGTFCKVFCTQVGHWMEWPKEYNCTEFISKEAI